MPRPNCCPTIRTPACRRSLTAAGLGRSTVYRQFASREELFDAVAADVIGRGIAAVEEILANADGVEEALCAIGELGIEFGLRYRFLYSHRGKARAAVMRMTGDRGDAAVGFPRRGPGARRDPRRSADRLDRQGSVRGDDRDDRRRARRSDRAARMRRELLGETLVAMAVPSLMSSDEQLRSDAERNRRLVLEMAIELSEPRSGGERAGDRRCLRHRPDHDLPALPEPREPARGRHRRDHRHRPRGDHGRGRRSRPGDCDPRPRRRLDRPRAPLRAPVRGPGRTERDL